MLDGGQELHVAAPDLVAEEAVDFSAAPLRAAVHDAQRVELDPRAAEELDALLHAVEGGLAPLRAAEGVVDVARPVERESHQEAVLGKEGAPPLVDQRAVGLERILDALAVGIAPLELQGAAVEVNAEQQRLAPVPAELHDGDIVGLDVLADVAFEQLVAHHRLTAAVLRRLVQIVAVAAVEVAARAGGLEHRHEGDGGGLPAGVVEGENRSVLHGSEVGVRPGTRRGPGRPPEGSARKQQQRPERVGGPGPLAGRVGGPGPLAGRGRTIRG
jgi:hypothetical protein